MQLLSTWIITIIGILLVSGCTKKLRCDSVEEDNPLLSITMFPYEGNSYTFYSGSDTVELTKAWIAFSQPYTASCNALHPLEDCHCETSYRQVYEDDRSKFLSEVWLSYSKDQPKSYHFLYGIRVNRSSFHGRFDFKNTDLAPQIDDILTEEILLGNERYFNVLVIEDYHDYTETMLTAVIEPGKGLIGYTVNGELYQLVE